MAIQQYLTRHRRATTGLAASTVLAPISLWWLLICWNVMGMNTETLEEMDRVYSAGNPEAWLLGVIGVAIGGGVCAAWVSRTRSGWRRFSFSFTMISFGTSVLFLGFWTAVFVGMSLGLVQ
jgi:hypothetical protein